MYCILKITDDIFNDIVKWEWSFSKTKINWGGLLWFYENL